MNIKIISSPRRRKSTIEEESPKKTDKPEIEIQENNLQTQHGSQFEMTLRNDQSDPNRKDRMSTIMDTPHDLFRLVEQEKIEELQINKAIKSNFVRHPKLVEKAKAEFKHRHLNTNSQNRSPIGSDPLSNNRSKTPIRVPGYSRILGGKPLKPFEHSRMFGLGQFVAHDSMEEPQSMKTSDLISRNIKTQSLFNRTKKKSLNEQTLYLLPLADNSSITKERTFGLEHDSRVDTMGSTAIKDDSTMLSPTPLPPHLHPSQPRKSPRLNLNSILYSPHLKPIKTHELVNQLLHNHNSEHCTQQNMSRRVRGNAIKNEASELPYMHQQMQRQKEIEERQKQMVKKLYEKVDGPTGGYRCALQRKIETATIVVSPDSTVTERAKAREMSEKHLSKIEKNNDTSFGIRKAKTFNNRDKVRETSIQQRQTDQGALMDIQLNKKTGLSIDKSSQHSSRQRSSSMNKDPGQVLESQFQFSPLNAYNASTKFQMQQIMDSRNNAINVGKSSMRGMSSHSKRDHESFEHDLNIQKCNLFNGEIRLSAVNSQIQSAGDQQSLNKEESLFSPITNRDHQINLPTTTDFQQLKSTIIYKGAKPEYSKLTPSALMGDYIPHRTHDPKVSLLKIQNSVIGGNKLKQLIQNRRTSAIMFRTPDLNCGRDYSYLKDTQTPRSTIGGLVKSQIGDKLKLNLPLTSKPTKIQNHGNSESSISDDEPGEEYGLRTLPRDKELSPKSLGIKKMMVKVCKLMYRTYSDYTSRQLKLEREFRAGELTIEHLQKMMTQTKQDKMQKDLEEFASSYDDTYRTNLDPRADPHKYLLDPNSHKTLHFLEKIKYFKDKQVQAGLRSPDDRNLTVFLNKRKVSQPTSATYFPLQKRIHAKQPKQICEIARIATLFLLKVYSNDPRYIVHPDEFIRLNVDSVHPNPWHLCCEHHLDAMLKNQNQKQLVAQVDAFNLKLKDPKKLKVHLKKQAAALVQSILTSNGKEFVKLRKKLQEHKLSENTAEEVYEEVLRQVNPEIFIADKHQPEFDPNDNVIFKISEIKNKKVNTYGKKFKVSKRVMKHLLDMQSISSEEEVDQPNDSGPSQYIDSEEIDQRLSQKLQFFEELKRNSLNITYELPQQMEQFCQNLHPTGIEGEKTFRVLQPIVNCIRDGILKIEGSLFNHEMILALCVNIKYNNVHTMILDDCQVTDDDFSALLKAVADQDSLQSLSVFKVQIGPASLVALASLLEQNPNLRSLSIISPRCDTSQSILLLEVLKEHANPSQLRLSGIDFTSHKLMELLVGNLELHHQQIQHLDLSDSTMSHRQIVKLSQALVDWPCQNLLILNLSNLIHLDTHTSWRQESTQKFYQNMLIVLQQSKQLQYVDFSGLRLNHYIIDLAKAIQEEQESSLIGIRFSHNDLEQKVKQQLMELLEVKEAFESPAAMVLPNLKLALLDDFEATDPTSKLLTSEIRQSIKRDLASELNSSPCFGKTKESQDEIVLTRYFDHPELLWQQSLHSKNSFFTNWNLRGKWHVNQLPGSCFYSGKFKYTQIYWGRDQQNSCFKKISDPRLLERLQDFIHLLGKYHNLNCQNPFLLTSANNWTPIKMLDLRIFCQMLKTLELQAAHSLNEELKTMISGEDFESYYQNYIDEIEDPKNRLHFCNLSLDYQEPIVMKWQEQKDIKNVELCCQDLIKCLSRMDFDAWQTLEGYDDQKQLFDRFTNTKEGQHLILQQSRPFQRSKSDNQQINKPTVQTKKVPLFVYAGFLKPGFHPFVIYDPETKGFWKTVDLIRPRSQLHLEVPKQKFNWQATHEQDQQIPTEEEGPLKPTATQLKEMLIEDFLGTRKNPRIRAISANYEVMFEIYSYFVQKVTTAGGVEADESAGGSPTMKHLVDWLRPTTLNEFLEDQNQNKDEKLTRSTFMLALASLIPNDLLDNENLPDAFNRLYLQEIVEHMHQEQEATEEAE